MELAVVGRQVDSRNKKGYHNILEAFKSTECSNMVRAGPHTALGVAQEEYSKSGRCIHTQTGMGKAFRLSQALESDNPLFWSMVMMRTADSM